MCSQLCIELQVLFGKSEITEYLDGLNIWGYVILTQRTKK